MHCSFRQSPVFNSKTGFGGDGVNGSRCVTDGPFASYNISLGPGRALNNTCLTRTFNERLVVYITSKQVANATIQPAFERFWMELEGERVETKPHSAGHRSIGGVMGDVYSSPGGKSGVCATGSQLMSKCQTRCSISIMPMLTAFGGSGK
jgi:tyrosinase